MNKKRGLKLIITGSINVDSRTPTVAILDPNIRLKSYIETIEWAINCDLFSEIIFCENSNYHGREFELLVDRASKMNKIFEYLSFQGNTEEIISHGKGYGEGEIIQYCLNNSKLVKFEKYDYFCKITGRLTIENITDLLPQKYEKNTAFFMRKEGLDQIDTRFYCINVDVYKRYFQLVYRLVDDRKGYFLEHAFYNTMRDNKIRYHMFLHIPLFRGAAGSTGRIYNDKPSKYKRVYSLLCITNLYNSQILWRMKKKFKRIISVSK